MRSLIQCILSGVWCIAFVVQAHAFQSDAPTNVVWIVADDLGDQLGCYGTRGVRTPNIDRLASQGIRFTNAFSSAPVCSASRSALITGVSQTAIGAQHHRTLNKQALPDGIEPLPAILAGHGVASFNGNFNLSRNGKTDYNFKWPGPPLYTGADFFSATTLPFFAQVQIYEPHRSFSKDGVPSRELILEVPPWLPDVPLVRADEAGYLASIEILDRKVGRILDRIEKQGLAGNTVVIFLGDHGRPQVRGKQWLYDAGLHVPLIIRWPGVVPPGSENSELVSLIDLAPTTLAVMGLPRPHWMHGRVLVGPQTQDPVQAIFAARDRCDETVDVIRCVRSNEYTYIRNLMPEKSWMQGNAYKDRQYPVRSLLRSFQEEGVLSGVPETWMSASKPSEELYDRRSDPDELINLADDPAYLDARIELGTQLDAWMLRCGDPGIVPEEEAILAQATQRAERARERTIKKIGFDPVKEPGAMVARSVAQLDVADQDGWRWLIVPGSFDGWHTQPGGTWEWRDDVIVGRSLAGESRHGLLVSDLEFGDFEVDFQFRALTGCSGFYFRVEEIEGHVGVAGFQAEIEPSFQAGGLYETRGRAWVVKPDERMIRACYTPGEWARMGITAKGGEVEVRLNGVLTAKLKDDPGRAQGRFALQLHGGQDLHVEFRNLKIRP